MEITREMIDECINDTSFNGKYVKFYQMLIDSIEYNIADGRLNSMISTLNYVGINCDNMSKCEIIFEYSKLI